MVSGNMPQISAISATIPITDVLRNGFSSALLSYTGIAMGPDTDQQERGYGLNGASVGRLGHEKLKKGGTINGF